MALNLQYDTKDLIPAGAAEHYVETDNGGKKVWVLQGQGFAPAEKLEEFRTNNRDLKKFKDEWEPKFRDVDPDEYRTLKSRAELLDGGKLIGAAKLEETINARLDAVKKEHGTTVEQLSGRLTAAEKRVAEFTIDGAAMKSAIEIGIAKGAQPDIINRVRTVFSMDKDGKLVATNPATGKEWYGSTGEMLTPGEYIKMLAAGDGAHLFAGNSGGGAGGSGGGGGGGETGENPWDPKTENLSEQMRIFRKDPELARRMATKHGKSLPGEART